MRYLNIGLPIMPGKGIRSQGNNITWAVMGGVDIYTNARTKEGTSKQINKLHDMGYVWIAGNYSAGQIICNHRVLLDKYVFMYIPIQYQILSVYSYIYVLYRAMKFRNATDANVSPFRNAKRERRDMCTLGGAITYARRLSAVEEFAVRYKMSGR
jgi:hypothetical protein